MSSAQWKVWGDTEATAQACGAHILSVLESALGGGAFATVAFSGGSTPKLMFTQMVRSGFDWTRVHVFQVDERAVPPDHADSNFRMMEEHLIRPARISDRNVHRIQAELTPQQAARQYEHEIREVFRLQPDELPHFDVLHLGMGSDAHTASLFPGERLIDNRDQVAAAVHVEKLEAWRITLLPGVLLSARHAAVLVTGEDKAESLREVLLGAYEPLKYPAQIVAHHSRRARWFVDGGAARLLAD